MFFFKDEIIDNDIDNDIDNSLFLMPEDTEKKITTLKFAKISFFPTILNLISKISEQQIAIPIFIKELSDNLRKNPIPYPSQLFSENLFKLISDNIILLLSDSNDLKFTIQQIAIRGSNWSHDLILRVLLYFQDE